jgi:aquaporin Z
VKKEYIAEALGTCGLSLVVLVLVSNDSLWTPVAAALTLLLFVYTIGSVSGTHINPAVTIGLWYMKKISGNDAFSYIASQFCGAIIALFLANILVKNLAMKLKPVQELVINDPAIGLAEAIGTFFLLFGIMSVVSGNTKKELSGLVIGGSLLAGLFVAGSTSNSVLNPAVALALGSINIMYIAGPVIGAVLGVRVYQILFPEQQRDELVKVVGTQTKSASSTLRTQRKPVIRRPRKKSN